MNGYRTPKFHSVRVQRNGPPDHNTHASECHFQSGVDLRVIIFRNTVPGQNGPSYKAGKTTQHNQPEYGPGLAEAAKLTPGRSLFWDHVFQRSVAHAIPICLRAVLY